MGTKTGIEWADATWNPIIGCSRVSEGCRNCYAEGIAGRFGRGKETVYSGLTQIVNGRAVWTGQIKETRQLLQPLSWKNPKRVFVNSMSDLFHENVSDELRDRIFAVMAICPQHAFQVLTKRPKEMLKYLEVGEKVLMQRWGFWASHVLHAHTGINDLARDSAAAPKWPLPNVWLGVSCENQTTADERIPLLLRTPAAKRFLSCEPLLGPLNIGGIGVIDKALPGWQYGRYVDWVICGGESGPHARPMHPDWARGLRDQCTASGVPFFFKQWGEWLPLEQQPATPIPDGSVGEHQCRWINADGRGAPVGESFAGLNLGPENLTNRVGKKAAGALLDGVEYKQFPKGPQ